MNRSTTGIVGVGFSCSFLPNPVFSCAAVVSPATPTRSVRHSSPRLALASARGGSAAELGSSRAAAVRFGYGAAVPRVLRLHLKGLPTERLADARSE